MIFNFAGLLPLMLMNSYRSSHADTLHHNALGIAVIAVCFSANLAFNNYSLALISLSLNQMIRSSIPVVTVLCSVFIEGYLPSKRELISLFGITAGVCAILAEDVNAEFKGVCFCVVSTVANGIMMSMSGRVLREKVDVWRLSFYQAPIVMLTLTPAYVLWEHAKVKDFFEVDGNPAYIISLIIITCAIALTYNAVHGAAIKYTSATTTTVIGQVKILLLLGLAAVLFGETDFMDVRTFLGGSLALFGLAMYSWERLRINTAVLNTEQGLDFGAQNTACKEKGPGNADH
jgi:drug/metabolite transporter (DMT)-like permease